MERTKHLQKDFLSHIGSVGQPHYPVDGAEDSLTTDLIKLLLGRWVSGLCAHHESAVRRPTIGCLLERNVDKIRCTIPHSSSPEITKQGPTVAIFRMLTEELPRHRQC